MPFSIRLPRIIRLKQGYLALSPAFVSAMCCSVLALGMTVGCATVEVVGPEHLHDQQFVAETTPVAHVYADNWGWHLFKYIPIVTGNLDKPGVPQLPVFFTDTVRVDLLVDQVTKESTKLGASIISDLRTRDRSYYAFWTLVFWLNEFEVSANASRPELPGDRQEPFTDPPP
jgi:hypothetical protein